MSYISKLLKIYGDTVVHTTRLLLSQIILVPLIILGYLLVSFLTIQIASLPLGIAGGFLLGLIQLSFIMYLYKWLILTREKRLPTLKTFSSRLLDDDPWAHVRSKQRGLWLQEILQFDGALFSLILNAAFPIFVVEFLVSLMGLNSLGIPVYLKLAIIFLFNPLPEVIIIQHTSGMNAIYDAMNFLKRFVLEWFFPVLVLFCPLLFVFHSPFIWLQNIILLFVNTELLIPGELVGEPTALIFQEVLHLGLLISLPIGALLGVFYALFRIELFERLQTLTR